MLSRRRVVVIIVMAVVVASSCQGTHHGLGVVLPMPSWCYGGAVVVIVAVVVVALSCQAQGAVAAASSSSSWWRWWHHHARVPIMARCGAADAIAVSWRGRHRRLSRSLGPRLRRDRKGVRS